eukprot:15432505-Alexandrium_andersonii.AAC.2
MQHFPLCVRWSPSFQISLRSSEIPDMFHVDYDARHSTTPMSPILLQLRVDEQRHSWSGEEAVGEQQQEGWQAAVRLPRPVALRALGCSERRRCMASLAYRICPRARGASKQEEAARKKQAEPDKTTSGWRRTFQPGEDGPPGPTNPREQTTQICPCGRHSKSSAPGKQAGRQAAARQSTSKGRPRH